ncbi:MAG: T9SS type A sorting domain-containing protein [Calditrichia bacterium]
MNAFAKIIYSCMSFCMLIAGSTSVAAQDSFLAEYYNGIVERSLSSQKQQSVQQDSTISLLSQWKYGAGGAVSATENAVFIANGSRIQIIDAKAANPYSVIGEIVIPYQAVCLLADDSLLFVSSDGLRIYDISEPADPVLLGRNRNLFGRRMVREGNRLFMVHWQTLVSVDISDPMYPRRLALGDVWDYFPTCIAVKDNYVFVADNEFEFGIKVFDATSFDSLNWVATINTNSVQGSAQVVDSFLYVFDGRLDCTVYNISDPLNATFVTYLSLPTPYHRSTSIAQSGDFLFLNNSQSGILSIDISEPASPIVADILPGNKAWLRYEDAIAASGGRVYAGHYSGLRIVNSDNPASLEEEEAVPLLASAGVMHWADQLLFISSMSGLWKFDVANPARPTHLGNVLGNTRIIDMQFEGDTLYVAAGSDSEYNPAGLYIYNVSNPMQPTFLAHFPGVLSGNSGRYVTSLTKHGDIVALGCTAPSSTDSTLQLIDVADVQNPQSIAILSGIRKPIDIAIEDSTLYVATFDDMKIYDISNPHAPIALGNVKKHTSGVIVENNAAYLLSSSLSILGVLNPASPTFLGEIEIASSASNVWGEVSGNYLYWSGSGFGVVDVSDLQNPFQIASVEKQSLYRMTVDGDYFAVVDSDQGLQIFRNNGSPLGIEDVIRVPEKFSLQQNYPNPFNPETTIQFSLSTAQYIELQIFDIAGRLIKRLAADQLTAGTYEYVWGGKNESGVAVSSGVYLYRLTGKEYSSTRKMVLLQ